MSTRMTYGLRAAAILALLTPAAATSQIRGSELGQVAQTLDGTTITMEYSRPVARGRELFGGIVPWNVVWTPGANWATTLDTDQDIRLNGVEVPAGTYSVWMIPREDQWTLTLNSDPEIFHFQKPDSAADQIHVAVDAEEGAHTEMLTWSFPVVLGDAAVLRMQWGATSVPVEVLAEPSEPTRIADDERAIFVGAYDVELIEGIGWPTTGRLEVTEAAGRLRGRLPFPIHPGDELEFDLVPVGMNRFSAGLYRDGEIFNIEMGFSFEFDVDERADAVTFRGIEGSRFGGGPRATNTATR